VLPAREESATRSTSAPRSKRAALFGEGPGAFVVSVPREAGARFGGRQTTCSARSAATQCSIEGVLDVALEKLSEHHGDGSRIS